MPFNFKGLDFKVEKIIIGNTDNAIKKVIFNGPATIVWFGDGEKVVVKCSHDDAFDYEKGLAMAVVKKLYSRNEFVKILNEAIEIDQNEDENYQTYTWGFPNFKKMMEGFNNDRE